MRIYVICSVKGGTPPEVAEHVARMEAAGHEVHFPPRDVDQDDPTGGDRICREHREAMLACDRVDVFYDERSGGSKFDLGMAYVLDRPIDLVAVVFEDAAAPKGYLRMLRSYVPGQAARDGVPRDGILQPDGGVGTEAGPSLKSRIRHAAGAVVGGAVMAGGLLGGTSGALLEAEADVAEAGAEGLLDRIDGRG